MIVSDDNVTAALAYLGDDEMAARAQFNATTRENAAKATFARLFLSYNAGPVAEREARATCNPEYMEAKSLEAEALKELARHKAKAKSCDMIVEIWRTENANARAAERIR